MLKSWTPSANWKAWILAIMATLAIPVAARPVVAQTEQPGGGGGEPSDGEEDGEEMEQQEEGIYMSDEMSFRYRIIRRVPNNYVNVKIYHIDPTFGWYRMHAEVRYGAQIAPYVIDSWLSGIGGGLRSIVHCRIRPENIDTDHRTVVPLDQPPEVGDEIEAQKQIKYTFIIEFRIVESPSVNIGVMEIPLFRFVYDFQDVFSTNWILKERQTWVVLEVLDDAEMDETAPDAPPVESNTP